MATTPRAGDRAERGSSTLEYVALFVLIAVLAGAVAVTISGAGGTIIDSVRRAVCALLGGEDCGEAPGDGSDAGDEPEPDPYDPCGLGTGGGPAGENDLARWERQAQRDAATLDDVLGGESGLGRPAGFVIEMGDPHVNISPMTRDHLAEPYPELVEFLAGNADRLDDEAYAAALVNELGAENVRSLVDRVNSYGMHDVLGGGPEDLDAVYRDYVEPLAALLSAADRSGQLDEDVRRAIVDTSPPSAEELLANLPDPEIFDEEDLADPEINQSVYAEIAWQLQIQRQRANALLLHAGDFSSRTTAEMAGEILNGPPPKLDPNGFTEGFGVPEFFEGGDRHPALADNRWIALQALADDPNAATLFYEDGDNLALGEGWTTEDNYDPFEVLLLQIEWRLDMTSDDVTGAMRETATNSLEARCV